MPLLGPDIRWVLSLGLLLGSGCFEDTTPGASGSLESGSASTAADSVDANNDQTGPVGPGDETAGCIQGCRTRTNNCLSGLSDDACGFGGEDCLACSASQFCDEGNCRALPLCTPENCAGCCEGDVCVSGLEETACGEDGERCEVCSDESTCAEGSCELPCEVACDGCCDDSGDCIPLTSTSETSCGVQGEACAPCNDAFACAEGICISLECQENCPGCCVGDECLNGDSLEACGVEGAACQACPRGTLCDEECTPDNSTLWQVFVESATTTNTAPNGLPWDSFGRPDPYVELTFGKQTASSNFDDNTTTPVWNELLFDGLTAEEILGDPGIFELWDDDFTPDESMGQCTFALTEDQFGVPQVADCTDSDGEQVWSLQFSIVVVE